jgi:hypothetical protein
MPTIVCIDAGPAGKWLISLPGRGDVIVSETLTDAIRQARGIAETSGSCQLIVRNAYHRVIDRQFIGDEITSAAGPPSRAPQHDQRARSRHAGPAERATNARR